MKVYLVDDHGVLRAGLAELLAAEPDIEVAGHSSSAEQALKFLDGGEIDVLITDQSMPEMDGLTLVREVRKRRPSLPIVVLTMHDELHLYRDMEREGVEGYVLKKDSGGELMRALRAVATGNRFVSDSILQAARQQDSGIESQQLLTRREREILRLITEEQSNRQIAETLFISELTVETHRKNIFRKTGAASIVGLVNFAHANGLIEPT